jgi:hypothetical protein
MSFLTDCAVLPDHVSLDCDLNVMGGFPSGAIVDRDHTITDWTSASQWNANIAAGKIKIIDRIKAEIPAASPVKSDNLVANGSQQTLDGFDWTASWVDGAANVFNDAFYSTLNKKSAFIVLWAQGENQIQVVDVPITFTAIPVYPGSNREKQMYAVTAEWFAKKDYFPLRTTAPTGIFQFNG